MAVVNWFKKRLKAQRRKELRRVNLYEGDTLIRAGWIIAKEEDTNCDISTIYLELLEPDYE